MTDIAIRRRNRRGAPWCFAALLVFATASSAESEFDMDLMQTVDDTSKELVSNLSLEDAAAADSNLADLDALLAQVETHYSTKGGADDAVRITQDARALLLQIHQHIGAGDFEAANLKQSEFSRNCKTCHKLYKKS